MSYGDVNAFEKCIGEEHKEPFEGDVIVEHMSENRKSSYDAEVSFHREGIFSSQEVYSSEKDVMEIDSESTYSCTNASSDEANSVDSEDEHEFTNQNGTLIDHNELEKYNESPNMCSSAKENDGSILGVSSDNIHDTNPDYDHESHTREVMNGESDEYIVPKVGVEFESEDHSYKCYSRYALTEGFSIRKDFVNRSKVTGFVVSRRYTCHRQGYGSSTNKHNVNVNKFRKETRTGCLAHMTVTRQPNGKYRVIHFETRHNHVFVTPVTAHLLPSQKRISFVEAIDIQSNSDNPIRQGVPKLGMGFESETQAYDFYNEYAGSIGFSVRKDYVNRSKIDGAVASRRYTCFREGYRQKDKRGSNVKRPRKETRVGCMAQMVISRQVDGKYRVTHFEESHNHELVPACKVQNLRSQKRSFTNRTEMQPKSLTELLLTGVGDLCFDPIDREMTLKSKRVRNIKKEEAESMHRYFLSKKSKDPSFFYALQLDVEEQMTNFFWADEKMMADYGDFGDVVCFDTTHMNRRPFVLFWGINNHKQIIVFGSAFMYDDTVESFKWLLRIFLKAMSEKRPKTILSDQDSVILEAIFSELPETNHRCCTWQVYQKTLINLSEVVANSDSFSSDLRRCIYNPDEENFVNSWKVMLDSYGLWENEWLRVKFEEREKWTLPYGKHIFSAEIETALLSEDYVLTFKKYLKPESHVLQFIKHFTRVVSDGRYKELEANYDMIQQMPRLMGDVITLKQVREVYTPIIFEMFHQEYENCLNIMIDQCVETLSSIEYKVSTYGQVRQYVVLYSSDDDSVSCSCMKFESVGILCSHVLKVLDYRNVKIVPSRYVLKRWTRDARA